MSLSKFATREDLVQQYLIDNGFAIIDIVNNNTYLLKTPLHNYTKICDKGFVKRDPHSQRPEAWNKDNIDKFLKDIVLPIYETRHVPSIPDLILAMCDEYKYNDEMYVLCLIDGGNRSRTLMRFCNVEKFTQGKKKEYDPCIDIIRDGKVYHLYFKRTELTIKRENDTGNVIYLSEEQQKKLLDFEITAKLEFKVHTFVELNMAFNRYQNGQTISKGSSEYLKNVNNPFGNFCSKNFIYKNMYELTTDLINSSKFYVQITVMCWFIFLENKTNFSEKSFLDILSNDDKNVNKQIRIADKAIFNENTEDFEKFKNITNRFGEFMNSFSENKGKHGSISMILFKSIFFFILQSPSCSEKILENIDSILSYDKEYNKKVWFGKSDKITKIPYNVDDIKHQFDETIQFLESICIGTNMPTIKKLKNNDKIIVDDISMITNKSTQDDPELVKAKKQAKNRDFGKEQNIYCLCCNEVKISKQRMNVGHIISIDHGGLNVVENLICICKGCNGNGDLGMRTENLYSFQERMYPCVPSAREYMKKFEVKDPKDITNYTCKELKLIAKNNKLKEWGNKQVLFDHVKLYL